MSITLTPAAAEHIKGYIAKRGKGRGLRLAVKNAGCSGLSYVVEMCDAVEPGDTVFEGHGAEVVVDAQSLPYLDGTVLDYSREGFNAGFKFRNPNEKGTCGCGSSFSV